MIVSLSEIGKASKNIDTAEADAFREHFPCNRYLSRHAHVRIIVQDVVELDPST